MKPLSKKQLIFLFAFPVLYILFLILLEYTLVAIYPPAGHTDSRPWTGFRGGITNVIAFTGGILALPVQSSLDYISDLPAALLIMFFVGAGLLSGYKRIRKI